MIVLIVVVVMCEVCVCICVSRSGGWSEVQPKEIKFDEENNF